MLEILIGQLIAQNYSVQFDLSSDESLNDRVITTIIRRKDGLKTQAISDTVSQSLENACKIIDARKI